MDAASSASMQDGRIALRQPTIGSSVMRLADRPSCCAGVLGQIPPGPRFAQTLCAETNVHSSLLSQRDEP